MKSNRCFLGIYVILTLLFISTFSNNSVTISVSSSLDEPYLEFEFTPSQQSVFQNTTFNHEVMLFVQRSQDVGDVAVPSMDVAYNLGMSIHYLTVFGYPAPDNLVAEVLNFINSSRNEDGGYGNWNGARSSVESTFQALQLLVTYNNLSVLSIESVNRTVGFLEQLKTFDKGYLPLPQWDAPDVSSTYRVIYGLNRINTEFPSISVQIDNSSSGFINSTFVPPIFVNGASGFSENLGGPAELLASLNAVQAYLLLNITDTPYFESVAKFMNSLIATNGGVAGYAGGLPTMGFTSAAIQLYHLFKTETSFAIDDYLPSTFLEDGLNYILANREAGSGFTASERDTTAELRSSFFALRILHLLDEHSLLSTIPDLTGVFNYLVEGVQPTFGYANYPGDVPDISYTAQAILIGKLIGNSSYVGPGVSEYVERTYSETGRGFGFRPGSSARVKYTHFGVRATRSLNGPLTVAQNIVQYLLDSQNEGGGFGERPGSTISYLTHTYWAITALNLLGNIQRFPIDPTSVLSWLTYLEKPDGTYSNFPGFNSTLTSTYRAMMIRLLLDDDIDANSSLKTTLADYQQISGGYVSSLDRTAPSMEATFYGVALSLMLDIPLNDTLLLDFVFSLQNGDGGFGLRPGFSSRVESTFYAILTLKLLYENLESLEPTDLSEDPEDFYSPIIVPTFIPVIDNYRVFQNSYVLSSTIIEPESSLVHVWVEADWTSDESGDIVYLEFEGVPSEIYQNEWIFIMGTFDADGELRFRVHASDSNGNSAVTEYYFLTSLSDIHSIPIPSQNLTAALLPFILPIFLIIGSVDGFSLHRRKRNSERSDVKMTLQSKRRNEIFGNESLNIIAFIMVFGTIAILARFFIQDAVLILENSIFLFRFLLGMIVILVGKYVIGLKTLGLFGPTVLVISLLALGPFWGLLIFLNIFVVGYVIRALISQFNLAVGFRIGILMIFTVAFVGLLELLGEIFLIPILSGSILVPIIITPWFIDRYVIESEQESQLIAFQRLLTTLGISIVSFILMSIDTLVLILISNPELWVVLSASVLYFGRNTKYTTVDKKRFTRLFAKGEDPLSVQIRNRNYIAKYNSSMLFSVINKYNLKDQFDKWRVPTAELYSIINSENQIDDLMMRLKTEKQFENGFVIKPSQSYGGKGIMVVKNRDENGNFHVGSEIYAPRVVETEIRKIVKGEYLTSQTKSDYDIVIIEEKVVNHPDLAKISTGLPDVRVIVFRGIPVMAMMRLSTVASDGL
ncbi:MAG: sugar-transfer associated ATP-grasp domain-containing protein, partial [Candidatus Thorarchaeota archaeon]